MKLYEQFLEESVTSRVINRVNTEVVNKEMKMKLECYKKWMLHQSPHDNINYELCIMRTQIQSIRAGISSAKEGIKMCVDKGCKEEIRAYILKLADLAMHQTKNYIRRKAVILA